MKGIKPSSRVDHSALAGAYELARLWLMLRKRRSAQFDSGMFADPAWDALLHLFVRDQAGETMTSADLAREADIAPSVMTRWLGILEQRDLVTPVSGSAGVSQAYAITDAGRKSMITLFSA